MTIGALPLRRLRARMAGALRLTRPPSSAGQLRGGRDGLRRSTFDEVVEVATNADFDGVTLHGLFTTFELE